MAMICITHGGDSAAGKEWRSELEIFGLPLVHITQGSDDRGKALKSKGIIAIGQYASGFFCFSQFGMGVICMSQFSLGLITFAQFGLGLFGMCQFGVFLKGLAQIRWALLG